MGKMEVLMGTTSKRAHPGSGKMGAPTSSAYKPHFLKAASWDGLLRRHYDMKAASGEDKRCGPHPRTKKITLPKLKFMEDKED